MANGMVWDGLTEYREALKRLPEECQAEAAKLIEGETNAAFVTISRVYGAHVVSGRLLGGLTIRMIKAGSLTPGRELRSASPIAWLFDNGSQARHWVSGKSTGKMWGRTPPTHIFARTVGRARRTLAQAYTAMLLRRGAASVTED